ncbi:MAG: hypothetical protein ACI4SG_05745 [Oligosphaeraceae bacterium]
MNIETPSEKMKWFPAVVLVIALVAVAGYFYARFHTPPRPLLTSEEFQEKVEQVTLDIPALLGEREPVLLTRCLFAFKASHVQVPYHRRKRFIALTPEEENILGQETLRQMEELELFYHDEGDERRVENLLVKLAPVLGEGSQDITYRLAYTSEVNAMSLIGGSLVITKGDSPEDGGFRTLLRPRP